MATMPIALPPFTPLPALWPAVPERRPRRHPKHHAHPTAARTPKLQAPHVTLDPSHTESTVLSLAQDPASGEPDRANSLHGKTAAALDPARAAEQEQLRQLALACMAGDAGAWQQLVRSQHRRIYGICYRFTGSQTDAEDLTQDVFVKLYRSLSSFDPAKGAFQTWIVTVTRNLLVDHFRRTRQDRATDSLDVTLADNGDGPTRAEQIADSRTGQFETVARQEMRGRIQNALKQISPELREAVILRDLEDLDYKEIAQVLRVPEGTVKSRISRGRAELARILQREGIHRPAAIGGAAQ